MHLAKSNIGHSSMSHHVSAHLILSHPALTSYTGPELMNRHQIGQFGDYMNNLIPAGSKRNGDIAKV